jgi:hypothetical protein
MAQQETDDDRKRADLERRGLLRRGQGVVSAKIIDVPPPGLPDGLSVLKLLLDERKTGR